MTKWLISANGKIYDHASSFEENGFIDWRQSLNFEPGDEVYIYCTVPIGKVMYRCLVERVNLSRDEIVDPEKFWLDKNEYNNQKTKVFAHLKLIEQVDREELSLANLIKHGLKMAPQKGMKMPTELAEYIDRYIHDDYAEGVFPESSIPDDSYEGAVRTAKVNRYERSSIARRKCIEFHGIRCAICNISFEEVYGDVGKDFIHVHHIVPLNQIGAEYKVDYKTDLIPVCPNCHAMLHRKVNGKALTVEELRTIIKKG